MPDIHHTSAKHSTDLVLDPFIWVDPWVEVIIRWEVALTAEQRDDLGGLCALVPYLGRSESLAQIRLLDSAPEVDDHWWRPDAGERPFVRLLQPRPDCTRKELEITTTHLRRQRLAIPPGTSLTSYGRVPEEVPPPVAPVAPGISMVRWKLQTAAPFRSQDGILATERLRTTRLRQAERVVGRLPSALNGKVDGQKVHDRHQHAHWFWLDDDRGQVSDLVLWMPGEGLAAGVASALVAQSGFAGFDRYNPRGFRPGSVHVVAMGEARHVVPELVRPARLWVARTPYIPVRHRKRTQSVQDWISRDVEKECEYRGLPVPSQVELQDRRPPTSGYRRYRWDESMRAQRPAFWVSIRFGQPLEDAVPLSLGGLSHFGFGLFASGL